MEALMHPLDRELLRQRNDGFSNDGLSYSVANDFGKLWGQAAADYEARAAAPRNDIYGNTLAEDRPEALRAQLLDPITQRFQQGDYRMTRPAPAARTYKIGNDIYSVDPRTGAQKKIIDTPDKPDTRGDSFEKQVILGKIATLRSLQADPLKAQIAGINAPDIQKQISDLENQGRAIFAKPTNTVPLVTAAPVARGFIGARDPLGNPVGDNGFVPPVQRGPKLPTRALAREYVSKYGAKAHDALKQDGFDLSGYAD